jgi:hypothetical protein
VSLDQAAADSLAGRPGRLPSLQQPLLLASIYLGLYLLGKDLIFAAASETLPGVCRDAKYLAKRLAATRAPQDEAAVQSGLAA